MLGGFGVGEVLLHNDGGGAAVTARSRRPQPISSRGQQMSRVVGVVLCLLIPGVVSAQGLETGFGIGVGGIKSADFYGLSLLGSLDARLSLAYGALGADISFAPTFITDSRYDRDEVPEGGKRCTDQDTGRFVDESKCIPLDAGAWAEIGGAFAVGANEIRLGVGGRLGSHSTVYGRVTYLARLASGTRVAVGGAAGSSFVQITVALGR